MMQVAILLGLMLCVVALYYPVLTTTYGFTDDYYDLQDGSLGGHNLWRHQVSEGRPLMGLTQLVLFPMAGRADHLGWLRAINLASLCVLAGAIYFTFQGAGFASLLAAAFSLGIAALPCFQICTAWAAMVAIPLAAVIAGVAASVPLSLARDWQDGSHMFRYCVAFLLLLASLLVYQPAAMFFWVYVAISLLTMRQGIGTIFHRFSRCLAVFTGSIIVGFFIFKLGTACYGASDPERAGLTRDVLGKAAWFIRLPLRNALNLDTLYHPKRYLAVVAALFAGSGLLLFFAGSWKQRASKLGIALVLIPLSYLPNLAAADSYGPHRTQVALTPLLAFYFVLALSGYLGAAPALSPRARESILLGLVGVWVCGAAVAARHSLVNYMTKPQAVEYQLVKNQLRDIATSSNAIIYFIPPGLNDRLTDFHCYDEFGTPSSFKVWAQEGMVKSVLREMGRDAGATKVVTITADELPRLPPETSVIDMRRLKELR
jgi:hypothetical protein